MNALNVLECVIYTSDSIVELPQQGRLISGRRVGVCGCLRVDDAAGARLHRRLPQLRPTGFTSRSALPKAFFFGRSPATRARTVGDRRSDHPLTASPPIGYSAGAKSVQVANRSK